MVAASQAAFLRHDREYGNVIGAATVELVDDDAGSVLFNVTTLLPGETTVNCIVVTYQGTAPDPAACDPLQRRIHRLGQLRRLSELGDRGRIGRYVRGLHRLYLQRVHRIRRDTHRLRHCSHRLRNRCRHLGPILDPGVRPPIGSRFVLNAAAPDAEQGESVTGLTFTWEVRSA